MFNLLAKILGTTTKTLEFVIGSKELFWKKLGLLIPLTIWSVILGFVSPLFIKFQVDALTQGWTKIGDVSFGSVINTFIVIVLGYFLINVLNNLFDWLKSRLTFRISNEASFYMEDSYINKLKLLDSSFLSSQNNVRMINQMRYQIRSFQDQIIGLIQLMFEIPASILALIFILPFLHPLIVLFMVVVSLINLWIDAIKSNLWRKRELIQDRQSEQVNDLSWQIFRHFDIFLGNNWLEQMYKLYQNRRQILFETNKVQSFQDFNFGLFEKFFGRFTDLVLYIGAGVLFINGAITIGTFSIFFTYTAKIQNLFVKSGDLFRKIYDLRFVIVKAEFLINLKPKLDYSNIINEPIQDIDTLELRNLDFTYPQFYEDEKVYLDKMRNYLGIDQENQNWLQKMLDKHGSKWQKNNLKENLKELEKMFEEADKNKQILKGLDFIFQKGKVYSIVGYNGAGKSTLIKLLKRSIDPTSGEIIFNGNKSLKMVDPITWRENICSMEQKEFLVDTLSIRDNLLLNAKDKNISDEIIWQALEKVGLKDKVTNLDQIIGEGVQFSGGQAQLLEIARILISPKSIVIMDEGTNQVDAIKEANIMNLVREIAVDSIVIFVTHRMTTCLKADQVIVLDNGKMQISGAPKELIDAIEPNLFQEFWRVQLGESK